MKKNKAFTLIELLVVISIIGILSSVVLSSLNIARAKSRDAKRKAEMTAIQTALEMYYIDNGSYPTTPAWSGVGYDWYGHHTGQPYNGSGVFGTLSGPTGYIPNLAPKYISVLPKDPRDEWGQWNGYLYRSDGVNYVLLDHNLPESWPSPTDKFYDPCRPGVAWKLCNTNDKYAVTCDI